LPMDLLDLRYRHPAWAGNHIPSGRPASHLQYPRLSDLLRTFCGLEVPQLP
jgi:hypothetical protein